MTRTFHRYGGGLAADALTWDNGCVGEEKDTELAQALAEVGRRVGQALSDALARARPAFDALADVANRPEVAAIIERAEKTMKRRPCLCFCLRAHPEDHGICEMFDAVITGPSRSELFAALDVPLCAPCAAARAARSFSG